MSRTVETPGADRLRETRAARDSAVRAADGMKEQENPLASLLRLNLECALPAAPDRGAEHVTDRALGRLIEGHRFLAPART